MGEEGMSTQWTISAETWRESQRLWEWQPRERLGRNRETSAWGISPPSLLGHLVQSSLALLAGHLGTSGSPSQWLESFVSPREEDTKGKTPGAPSCAASLLGAPRRTALKWLDSPEPTALSVGALSD
jgi:hypothetical protein